MKLNSTFDIDQKPFNFLEIETRILEEYPELKMFQENFNPMEQVIKIQNFMMENLKTAVEKEFIWDLTPDEANAICYYTGCHGTWVDGKLRFEKCWLYKKDGKWRVNQYV